MEKTVITFNDLPEIVAQLRELLPPLKVKKSTTSPPYNYLYITTFNVEKSKK